MVVYATVYEIMANETVDLVKGLAIITLTALTSILH